jgi:hypothetical protein
MSHAYFRLPSTPNCVTLNFCGSSIVPRIPPAQRACTSSMPVWLLCYLRIPLGCFTYLDYVYFVRSHGYRSKRKVASR